MRVLLTGASGFLGKALTSKLIARGDTVYGLSRHPPEVIDNLIPLKGDVTEPYLGLSKVPEGIERVYHLAAVHHLGDDKNGNLWRTNVMGTRNVINFCASSGVNRLLLCSTAYTRGRNPYERSKGMCEDLVRTSGIRHVTIFKPSIVMGTEEYPYYGHFSQFALLAIRIHRRAEIIRRKVEGTLRLPILEPTMRIVGDPEGKLNLIPVDSVVNAMANIHLDGTFWSTNPNPPTLGQLLDWISEYILVNLRFETDFRHTPIESIFQRRARAFSPYLMGDDFPSDVEDCPEVTKEFIHETIKRALLSHTIDKK